MFLRNLFKNPFAGPSGLCDFVPATRWTELRDQYPAESSQPRGLRKLTDALATENAQFHFDPELRDSRTRNTAWIQREIDSTTETWNEDWIAPTCLAASERHVDACFGSDQFMDDLEWSLQTYDIRVLDQCESIDTAWEESVLDTVTELSEHVSRVVPKRARPAPVKPRRAHPESGVRIESDAMPD